jgi:adenine/guanine phosphoribosyltransferase-like PRPP-binding protein
MVFSAFRWTTLPPFPISWTTFREQLDLDNAVVVATDAGGAKRAGRFAKRIHLPMAIIDKRRVADTEVVQGLVVGDVKGRDAIIFEDEISTGGTLAASVKTLAAAGVKSIHVGATHGVLCGPAVKRLVDSPIKSVAVTDTVHIPPEKRCLPRRSTFCLWPRCLPKPSGASTPGRASAPSLIAALRFWAHRCHSQTIQAHLPHFLWPAGRGHERRPAQVGRSQKPF